MEEQILLRNIHLVDPRIGRRDPEEIPYFGGSTKWRIGFENGRPRPVGSYLTFDYVFSSSRANSSGNNADYTNQVTNSKNSAFLVQASGLVGISYTSALSASALSSQQPALLILAANNEFNAIVPNQYHYYYSAANNSYNNVVNTGLGYGMVVAAQAVNSSNNVADNRSTSKNAKEKEITKKVVESGKNVVTASKNIPENNSATKAGSSYISEKMFSLFEKSSESCFVPFWMARDYELVFLLDEAEGFLKSRKNIQVGTVDVSSKADSSNNFVEDNNLIKESSTIYREYIDSTIDVVTYVLEFAEQDLLTPEQEEEIFDALQILDDDLNELYPDNEIEKAESLEDSQLLLKEVTVEDDIAEVSLKKHGSMKFDSVRLTKNLHRLSMDIDRLSMDAGEADQGSISSIGNSANGPLYMGQELSAESMDELESADLEQAVEKKIFGSFRHVRNASKNILRYSLEAHKSSDDIEGAYLLEDNDPTQKEDTTEIFDKNMMLGRRKQYVPVFSLCDEEQDEDNEEEELVSPWSPENAIDIRSKEVPPISKEEEEFLNSLFARMRGGSTIQADDDALDKQSSGSFTERDYHVSSELENGVELDIAGKNEFYDFH